MRRFCSLAGLCTLIALLGCTRNANTSRAAAPKASAPQASPLPMGAIPGKETGKGDTSLLAKVSSSPALPRPSGPADLGDLSRPAPARSSARPGSSPSMPAKAQMPQSGPYALLGLSPIGLRFPEDYELGPVQPEFPPDAKERAAAAPAFAFLSSLKEGKLDEASILPDRLSRLNQALYPFLRAKATLSGFRLGLLRIEGDIASGRALLSSSVGQAIAEIHLQRSPSGWKVESFIADFGSLDTAAGAKNERFEPGDYKAFTPF